MTQDSQNSQVGRGAGARPAVLPPGQDPILMELVGRVQQGLEDPTDPNSIRPEEMLQEVMQSDPSQAPALIGLLEKIQTKRNAAQETQDLFKGAQGNVDGAPNAVEGQQTVATDQLLGPQQTEPGPLGQVADGSLANKAGQLQDIMNILTPAMEIDPRITSEKMQEQMAQAHNATRLENEADVDRAEVEINKILEGKQDLVPNIIKMLGLAIAPFNPAIGLSVFGIGKVGARLSGDQERQNELIGLEKTLLGEQFESASRFEQSTLDTMQKDILSQNNLIDVLTIKKSEALDSNGKIVFSVLTDLHKMALDEQAQGRLSSQQMIQKTQLEQQMQGALLKIENDFTKQAWREKADHELEIHDREMRAAILRASEQRRFAVEDQDMQFAFSNEQMKYKALQEKQAQELNISADKEKRGELDAQIEDRRKVSRKALTAFLNDGDTFKESTVNQIQLALFAKSAELAELAPGAVWIDDGLMQEVFTKFIRENRATIIEAHSDTDQSAEPLLETLDTDVNIADDDIARKSGTGVFGLALDMISGSRAAELGGAKFKEQEAEHARRKKDK